MPLNIDSGQAFGLYTGLLTNPRVRQFALRYEFEKLRLNLNAFELHMGLAAFPFLLVVRRSKSTIHEFRVFSDTKYLESLTCR